MLYNEEEKKWKVVLIGDDENNHEKTTTGDGIRNDDTYELNYKFSNTGFGRNLITVKGLEMTRSTLTILNDCFGEEEDLMKIRREVQQFVVLYGTGLIDKTLFRKIKKKYPREIVDLVKGGLKGKGKYYPILMDFISTYLYLTCIVDNEKSLVNNSMTIVDSVGTKGGVEDREYYSKKGEGYWKNQNVTKRLGIKSLDEFMKGFSGGVLSYEWGSIS